jgi:hypothetical protein
MTAGRPSDRTPIRVDAEPKVKAAIAALKKRLHKSNLSAVADHLQVSMSSLNRFCNPEIGVGEDIAKPLCDGLEIDPEEILDRSRRLLSTAIDASSSQDSCTRFVFILIGVLPAEQQANFQDWQKHFELVLADIKPLLTPGDKYIFYSGKFDRTNFTTAATLLNVAKKFLEDSELDIKPCSD